MGGATAGLGAEHPEWRRRLHQARDEVIPWIEQTVSLAEATVLEYGCGQGAVSCAIAPVVAHHIGFDIDPAAIALARGHAIDHAVANSELHAVPEDAILARVREHTGAIDVFLLYAVLEHLTLDERLDVLSLAREVVRPDGHIIICETPNRLTPIDHHTGQIPFLHALPMDVAERYYGRSPRSEFVDAINEASTHGRDTRRAALARWGRGVSYHDFELVFEDLAAHTVASSYHPLLYPGRPVRGEELQLAAFLDAWRPDLPPCWSRTWLDMVLGARAQAAPPAHVRPWAMALGHDVAGAAMHGDGRIELRPGARLEVRLPALTDELHVGLMAAETPATALRIGVAGTTLRPRASAGSADVPQWHAVARLPERVDRLELSLRDGGCLTFVGYRGPVDPSASARRALGW